jgi:predicted phage-related endonuclease
MGEASKGIYQGTDGTTWGISWGTVKGRIGFDSKQFEKDHPELYLKYMKQGADYRRFMVKGKKTEITSAEMAMIGG